jgi:hypothetical protein
VPILHSGSGKKSIKLESLLARHTAVQQLGDGKRWHLYCLKHLHWTASPDSIVFET